MLNPLPALKASDRCGRVIYVSSLSKALSPGLRLGFMVADPDLIDEAGRCGGWCIVIRRPIFSIRWPISSPRATMKPTCGAITTAQRWDRLNNALQQHLPECRIIPGSEHANAFWLARRNKSTPAADLARRPRRC